MIRENRCDILRSNFSAKQDLTFSQFFKTQATHGRSIQPVFFLMQAMEGRFIQPFFF